MAGNQFHQLKSAKDFFRNFLQIKNSREFLIFLLFLFVAFLFWYLMTMTNEYEMRYSPTLKLKHVPKELMVIEPLPEKIEIILKDKGDKLIEYKARGKFKELVIDYRQHVNNMGHTAIHGAELSRLITAKLDPSTQVMRLSVDTLSFYVGSAHGKKLPVRVAGHIEANNQYQVDRIKVIPDSVTVYAASAYLDTMKAVYTPKVDYSDLTDSVSQTITLGVGMSHIKYEPTEVELKVAVSPYVTKSIEVPITGYLFPYGISLKTFPSRARVTFRVSLEDYAKITEKDFSLQVHYSQIKDNPSGKISPILEVFPSYISNVKVDPEEVDYLMEVNVLPTLQ